AADAHRLVQLRDEGEPRVPMSKDGDHPFSVDCGQGAIVLTQAVAHEPPGILAAWDIRTTTYALEGSTVHARTEETADNVLPAQLPRRYPQLVRHTLFASCRV